MKNRIIFYLLPLALLSCDRAQTANEEAPETGNGNQVVLTEGQLKSAAVSTAKVEKVRMASVIKLNGKVEAPPQNLISVSAPLGGYLRSTRLLAGMKVRKGEVLAVMEDQRYITLQEEYLTARTGLGLLETEFRRQQELNVTKSSSDKTLQQAEAAFAGARIRVASLSEQLKLIGIDPSKLDENTLSRSVNIYSPVNGYVSSVNVNTGRYVTPTEVMFSLVDPGDIHLALTVFERDVARISPGQKVLAHSNSRPSEVYECEVILVGKALSAERLAEVHCHFLGDVSGLLPGTYMNAEITLNATEVDAVSQEAVVLYQGRNHVFVSAGNGRFEMTEVETGATHEGKTEIRNAEKIAGREVAVQGAYHLLMALQNKPEE